MIALALLRMAAPLVATGTRNAFKKHVRPREHTLSCYSPAYGAGEDEGILDSSGRVIGIDGASCGRSVPHSWKYLSALRKHSGGRPDGGLSARDGGSTRDPVGVR
jgi:hypothetical protein